MVLDLTKSYMERSTHKLVLSLHTPDILATESAVLGAASFTITVVVTNEFPYLIVAYTFALS